MVLKIFKSIKLLILKHKWKFTKEKIDVKYTSKLLLNKESDKSFNANPSVRYRAKIRQGEIEIKIIEKF